MTTTRGKHILIVDDNEVVLQSTKEALEAVGFTVFVAQDMEQLEDLVRRETLDLVLMDVQMPQLYGDDVAMVLREVRGIDAPIHLLSGLDEDELAARTAEANLDGYISKLVGLDSVVARVQEICAEGGSGAGEA